jgi:hypothetical protein
MEAQDPLSELADIHLPTAVNIWPPAIGWWILAAALALVAAYYARVYFHYLIRLKRLSYAIEELETVYQNFSEKAPVEAKRNQAGLDFLNDVNAILRRVTLLLFPNTQDIAKLNGQAWLAFLDKSDNSLEFSTGAGKALSEGVYQRNFEADADALYALARRWTEQRYKEQATGIMLHSNKANTQGAKA